VILVSEEFSEELFKSLQSGLQEYVLTSAFIKLEALKKMQAHFSDVVSSITVIARWRKHDLAMGASDLEVYEYCASQGWRFGIDQNLHGKVYLIDRSVAYLGSANLTQSGLLFDGKGNREFGTRLPVGELDVNKIDRFISEEVCWMTDEIYQEISNELRDLDIPKPTSEDSTWSSEVTRKISRPANHLWVDELLFNEPMRLLEAGASGQSRSHDLELLGLGSKSISEECLRQAFQRTKLYFWLASLLERERSARFGYVTAKLHDAILNDPAPYRREVKDFVRSLFAWCEFVPEIFNVTAYARTSSIELVKSKRGDDEG